jgi:hypothetical protein
LQLGGVDKHPDTGSPRVMRSLTARPAQQRRFASMLSGLAVLGAGMALRGCCAVTCCGALHCLAGLHCTCAVCMPCCSAPSACALGSSMRSLCWAAKGYAMQASDVHCCHPSSLLLPPCHSCAGFAIGSFLWSKPLVRYRLSKWLGGSRRRTRSVIPL